MDYNILIYVIFGISPCLIWLFYYLRKDLHPEPKRMILNIFLWGALITIPVFFVQIGLTKILGAIASSLGFINLDSLLGLSLSGLNPLTFVIVSAYWFLVISFTEEIFKYLVVKIKVVGSSNLDEPLDIMLCMVIAALGFAAVENILYLFTPIGQMSFEQLIHRTLLIALIRFVGAIFLHTLCSAVIGYSMAISFCEVKMKKISLIAGILLATFLHGLYNFTIITLDGYARFVAPGIIILILAFLVFSGFDKLKKMRGICKIN